MSDESENIFDFLGIDGEESKNQEKELEKQNFEKIKKDFLDNLKMLKEMSNEELILYKKWLSLKDLEPPTDEFKESFLEEMWKPKDIFNREQTIGEIEQLKPYVEYVEDRELAYRGTSEYKKLYPFSTFDSYRWQQYREYTHSADHSVGPGRSLKFVVKNLDDGRVLGIFMLCSDVVAIKGRDQFVGWTQDNKMKDGKLRNTAIGSTISPIQPAGFNFVLGKLISCMVISQTPRKVWQEKFGDVLAGVTTTSLYGIKCKRCKDSHFVFYESEDKWICPKCNDILIDAMSQYTGIPYINSLGVTAGKMSINPDEESLRPMFYWLKNTYPEEFEKNNNDSNPKQKVLKCIYKKLGIKSDSFDNLSPRGCYFAPIYHNTPEFLRGEIDSKDLIPKPFAEDESVYSGTSFYSNNYTVNWWKNKSKNRYLKLYSEKRLSEDYLFYGDCINITWSEAKEKFLKDLGR